MAKCKALTGSAVKGLSLLERDRVSSGAKTSVSRSIMPIDVLFSSENASLTATELNKLLVNIEQSSKLC